MSSIAIKEKPHAVIVPFPAQGHINPLLQLAKVLHYKGFHITFVNTEFNHNCLLASQGPNSLDGLPSFRFATIPDGLPIEDADSRKILPVVCRSTSKHCIVPFKDLISKLNSTPNSPNVTCIVADGVTTFTLDAAEEFGIPEALFWTTSACGFMGYVQYHRLVEKGLIPLKDDSCLTNGYLDTLIDWIPGMKDVRLKDIPTFARTTDPEDIMLNFMVLETERSKKASAIILNTFDAMEHEVLTALSANLPPIYSIGPLQLHLNKIPDEYKDLKLIGSSLWAEDRDCIEWLNTKEPNSVVYVNFGSMTVMSSEQLIEFAWGLANSQKAFFWVIRPGLVAGDMAVVPPEFWVETKDRGRLASWCAQEQVLMHSAIGGFLTHSGWNSTLETVCGGVPVICWPFRAEQQTNCRYTCTEWGIGLEIEKEVKRDYIEGLVRKLMEGEEGEEMRRKAAEWKSAAEEAAAGPKGSSFVDLENLVSKVLLSQIN